MTPEVNDEVWALRPDFAALSVVVRNGRNAPGRGGAITFDRLLQPPAWAEGHFEAWRDAYRAFGARPQRTPCSAEALWRRMARDGAIASINAVVDLYNEVSLRYAVPVGGEDLSAYAGAPRLVRATGNEPFQTIRDGQPMVETADPGEVIWRDDSGVTCRRWNWRQTSRTRLQSETTRMWFILERLDPLPMEALLEAGDVLVSGLRHLAPGAEIATTVVKRPAPDARRSADVPRSAS